MNSDNSHNFIVNTIPTVIPPPVAIAGPSGSRLLVTPIPQVIIASNPQIFIPTILPPQIVDNSLLLPNLSKVVLSQIQNENSNRIIISKTKIAKPLVIKNVPLLANALFDIISEPVQSQSPSIIPFVIFSIIIEILIILLIRFLIRRRKYIIESSEIKENKSNVQKI